jgi:hypothetical protein
VDAEDVLVDECTHGQEVERLAAEHPEPRVAVVQDALVIETIAIRDLTALVIPSQQMNRSRMLKLQTHRST